MDVVAAARALVLGREVDGARHPDTSDGDAMLVTESEIMVMVSGLLSLGLGRSVFWAPGLDGVSGGLCQ